MKKHPPIPQHLEEIGKLIVDSAYTVEQVNLVWEAQILSHLKLTSKEAALESIEGEEYFVHPLNPPPAGDISSDSEMRFPPLAATSCT